MKFFGTGGLFACGLIVLALMGLQIGLVKAISLMILTAFAYVWMLGLIDSATSPGGGSKKRHRRHRRRYR